MTTLKAAAIDIDGVLVADTFSPVIKWMVETHGGTYDREVERNVFSQNRHQAARYLIDRLGREQSEQEFLDHYFQTREQWIAEHGGGPVAGITEFLDTLTDAGLRLVCYGGLAASHFEKELAPWVERFETYVCTNDFRPGVAEIVQDTLVLAPAEVVFFDDVSRVAEAARSLGCPFIGTPAGWPWGHQRHDMEALGVPLLLGGLADLTPALLSDCDRRAQAGYWKRP